MARPLTFHFGDSDVAFEMNKIDRSRLYGFKEVEVQDEDGQQCSLATLASDGRTIVGKGGTALGYIDASGNWADKSALKPVNSEGEEITPVTSSFSAPVPLTERTTIDEYLRHNIRAVYQLSTDDDVSGLLEELNEGAIYRFSFSYRGGLEADAAFLLTNNDGELFMVIGTPASVQFIGLQQASGVAAMEEADEEDGGDMMDFDMI